MKIVADENISYAREAFSHLGEVELHPGRKITNEVVHNADALIVRSITEVNEDLLIGSNVKFVGTATIGYDHIDTEYLSRNNISFTTAAGCNAWAVTEYVMTILFYYAAKNNFKLNKKSVGIIGCGNIGSKVKKCAEILGMKVLVNDPPLQKNYSNKKFNTLEETLKADFVTFHVPLNMSGIYKSYHLLDDTNINLINKKAVVINTSRGAVVCNKTLLHRIKRERDISAVLDVWENEPELDVELLKLTDLATPHIAGYTFEGKVNGTLFVYHELCDYFGIKPIWKPELPAVENCSYVIGDKYDFEKSTNSILQNIYSIEKDSSTLKGFRPDHEETIGSYFDGLRKNYNLRREFDNFTITTNPANKVGAEIFKALRFKINLK